VALCPLNNKYNKQQGGHMLSSISIDSGNITLKQGTTAELRYIVKSGGAAVNVTGWKCRLQVRDTVDSATTRLSKTTEDGSITTDPLNGLFVVAFTPAESAAVRFKGDELSCVYDTEVEDASGNVFRIAEGAFTFDREVTR
jgi:hypothetical protein